MDAIMPDRPFLMTTAKGLPSRQPAVCFSVTAIRRSAGRCRPDQVRMTRAVAFIFDQVKDLINRHAEMHADRARLVAELEQARRPWWQRLMTLTIDRPQRPTSRTSDHILRVTVGLIQSKVNLDQGQPHIDACNLSGFVSGFEIIPFPPEHFMYSGGKRLIDNEASQDHPEEKSIRGEPLWQRSI